MVAGHLESSWGTQFLAQQSWKQQGVVEEMLGLKEGESWWGHAGFWEP
jgi:hypothetical protein